MHFNIILAVLSFAPVTSFIITVYEYFKVSVLSNSTTIGGMTQTDIGNNVAILATAGSTTTGDSKEGVSATTGSATTLPFRVIAGVPETVNSSGSFTEVIVKFNFGVHTYYSATAVATAA